MHSSPLHPPPLRSPAVAAAMPTPAQPGRAALAGAAMVFVAYFAALHVLVVRGIAPRLTIGLIAGPWIAALAACFAPRADGSARRARAVPAAVALVVLGVAAWAYGDRLVARVDVVLYVENLVFLSALCGLFAATLSRGREPLITRLARTARGGQLPTQALGYTRGVTIVWAAFFASMALISTLLFATQSREVWSTFVNLLIWPSMAVLFALEYAVRLRVLRDIPHVPMMRGVDAFRRRPATDPATAPGGPECARRCR